LRAADEVRAADFTRYEGDVDAEAVAIATMIIKRKLGAFDPTTFRDRYQDALRELVEAKTKGLSVEPQPAMSSAPVIDLITSLKRSLAQEDGTTAAKPRRKAAGDKRQRNLLLPMAGKRQKQPAALPADIGVKRRRKA
jgi:DNA end-binding protein Ku